jgi:hypothetical protein
MTTPKTTPALCPSGRSLQRSPNLHQTINLSILLFLAAYTLPLRICLAYSGGTGEPNNPYQIANAADLLYLGSDEPNYDKSFILTADIDLASYNFSNSVIAAYSYDLNGVHGYPFVGSFDGADHKINNLTINASENAYGIGLFGKTGTSYDEFGNSYSEIKNLNLENINIIFNNSLPYTGPRIGGIVADNEGITIDNCKIFMNITSNDTGDNIGGLVGYSKGGSIVNCFTKGNLWVSSNLGAHGFTISGGLVGYNYESTIISSYSDCNIFCQFNDIDSFVWIGGLVGYNTGEVNDCYSTSSITGSAPIHSYYGIGGLMGANLATIRNCYSVGEVNVMNICCGYVGGLVGQGNEDIIISSYFLDVNGPANGLGTPRSDAQMRQQATFVGWDFVNVWWILQNVTYPKLNWQRYLPPGGPGGPGGPGNGLYFPDYNFDGIVNFVDFAILADAWHTDNPFISLDNDSDVDIYDLAIFCDNWLK